jgi:hypothetical protein
MRSGKILPSAELRKVAFHTFVERYGLIVGDVVFAQLCWSVEVLLARASTYIVVVFVQYISISLDTTTQFFLVF